MSVAAILRPFLAGLAFLAAPAGAFAQVELESVAPLFSCRLLERGREGGKVALSSLLEEGKVVVLSFFHTQCKPCIREIPRLTEAVKSRKDWPVAAYLVFVGTEDDETVREFIDKHGFSLPVLMDREGLWIGEKFGVVKDQVALVPQIVVIGKNGAVKASWLGFKEGMEAKLASLLGELAEAKQVSADDETICLLFTNNANGMIKPAAGMEIGGLARREEFVRRARAGGAPVVLVDSGDFSPVSPDAAGAREMAEAMGRMGYDAVTIGEAEFVNGLGFLREAIGAKSLPFVSSNVKICQGEELCVDLAKSQTIVSAGKRKVAILGFMHKGALGFTPRSRLEDGKWAVKIVEHEPRLKGFIRSYRPKADVLVALSHAGVDEDRKLAAEMPGIDVIVGGHSQTMMTKPEQVGDTVIVQAGGDGQYIGKLELGFGPGGRIRVKSYKLVPLGREFDKAEK